jgi:hypothetical protein
VAKASISQNYGHNHSDYSLVINPGLPPKEFLHLLETRIEGAQLPSLPGYFGAAR